MSADICMQASTIWYADIWLCCAGHTDNLKLFHELRGPVFSAPISPAIVIPSSLPQRPLLDFHQHPALFSMFDPDADPPQQQ